MYFDSSFIPLDEFSGNFQKIDLFPMNMQMHAVIELNKYAKLKKV